MTTGSSSTALQYAQQHCVLQLLQRMTEALLQDRPSDPVGFLTNWLKSEGGKTSGIDGQQELRGGTEPDAAAPSPSDIH